MIEKIILQPKISSNNELFKEIIVERFQPTLRWLEQICLNHKKSLKKVISIYDQQFLYVLSRPTNGEHFIISTHKPAFLDLLSVKPQEQDSFRRYQGFWRSGRLKKGRLYLNKRRGWFIIIICLLEEKPFMYYIPLMLDNSAQNSLLFPLNFIIPQPYPYIIDTSLTQNFSSLAPNHEENHKQTVSPLSPKRISKNKKEKVMPERIKIQKLERETRTSLPDKERNATNREFVMEMDDSGRLNVKIEWRNQNRNIIPNIMNQLLSYLTKPYKSKNIIEHLFKKETPNPSWTSKRYYNYIRIIKQKTSHYLDESDLRKFFVIQSPHCEIYSHDQQQFYMKLCRILVVYFLRNEVVLIASTSTRMNEYNRKIHLLGREILLKIFTQTAAQFRQK